MLNTIDYAGRLFRQSSSLCDAISDHKWATGVLSRPPVTYPNGRNSHEVANEVLERAEDVLIDYQLFNANAFAPAQARRDLVDMYGDDDESEEG